MNYAKAGCHILEVAPAFLIFISSSIVGLELGTLSSTIIHERITLTLEERQNDGSRPM